MVDPQNPYRPPVAISADSFRRMDDGLAFQAPVRTVPSGNGAAWIGAGWEQFKRAPGMWIVAMLVYVGLTSLISAFPGIGSIANIVLGPVFMAGLLAFAQGVAQGGSGNLNDLFAGFRGSRTGDLVVVGVLYLALLIAAMVIGAIFLVVFSGVGIGLFTAADPEKALQGLLAAQGILLVLAGVLVVLGLVMLAVAAYWFAPALVFFAGMSPADAMKESFLATFRNWAPCLVYGLLVSLVLLGGFLALVIGLVVALPVVLASYYASFEDLYAVGGELPANGAR